jgi:hypothetical protein
MTRRVLGVSPEVSEQTFSAEDVSLQVYHIHLKVKCNKQKEMYLKLITRNLQFYPAMPPMERAFVRYIYILLILIKDVY